MNLDLGMTGPVRRLLARAWARGLLRIAREGEKYVFQQELDLLRDDVRTMERLAMWAKDER